MSNKEPFPRTLRLPGTAHASSTAWKKCIRLLANRSGVTVAEAEAALQEENGGKVIRGLFPAFQMVLETKAVAKRRKTIQFSKRMIHCMGLTDSMGAAYHMMAERYEYPSWGAVQTRWSRTDNKVKDDASGCSLSLSALETRLSVRPWSCAPDTVEFDGADEKERRFRRRQERNSRQNLT